MIDLDDLKKRIDMTELCEALGLQPKGKVARCPAHNDAGDGRPNLAIYPDHVFCFRCDFNADALGLVAKAKGLDFPEAVGFLAARLGLDVGDAGRGRGLGNRARGNGATPYPKPAPLPSTPSPTLATGEPVVAAQGNGLGYEAQGDGATPYPKPADDRPPLPEDLVADFASFAEAWGYFDQVKTNFAAGLSRDRATGRFKVAAPLPLTLAAAAGDQVDQAGDDQLGADLVSAPGAPTTDRRSLRVQVFAALLAQGEPSSATPAGRWLHQVKGITPATQELFGIVFLDDPRAAAGELIARFGLDALVELGIYAKGDAKKGDGRPYFVFKRHRLLFPFHWKGEPVDCQGRDWETDAKGERFRNTASRNPLPYNADDLVVARAAGEPIFICEGATDTLALAQSGRLVVGIVGTGGFKVAWLPYFDGLSVYLALDADEAGQKAAAAIAKVFTDAGHRPPKVVKLPAGVKDVNQYFLMERETK